MQNGEGVSQNREKSKIEFIHFYTYFCAGEHDATLKKMFWGREVVEKSIFLNPDFGSTNDFEQKWKSTLQRMGYISKLGF